MAAHPHPGDAHARVIVRLREQAEDIRRLASGLTEDLLATRSAPDKWSIKELVCHLWRVQEVFEARVESMLTQSNPPITPWEPEGDEEFEVKLRDAAEESLEGFLAEREQFLTLLESLPHGDWHRPGRHPEFPHYDVHFQVEYMTHHEAHHLYQMFQRRAQLAKLPD